MDKNDDIFICFQTLLEAGKAQRKGWAADAAMRWRFFDFAGHEGNQVTKNDDIEAVRGFLIE